MEPLTVSSLTAVLSRMLPEPHAGLLAGILFGTRAALSRQLTDAFITTGTIHIIALSGQNVSLLSALVASSLTWVVSRRIASLLTLFILALYLWFVGLSPSLVRAVIMGSLTLFAVIFGKRNLSLLSLVLAVSTMLVLNPLWIGDLGFQLSVLATLGIILFGGTQANIQNENRNKLISIFRFLASSLWRFIQNDLRITLAAQLFTTPLIFFHFRRLSIIAPLSNVLIGWTMPFLMVLGWAAAIAGYLWLPLGLLPAWVSWLLLAYVIRVVEVTAGFPTASVGW